MLRPLNSLSTRLIRKRWLLWTATLTIILLFLGSLTSIFWFVRMKVPYTVRMRIEGPPGRQTVYVTIPRQPFQVVKAGDEVDLSLGESFPLSGFVKTVKAAEGGLELIVETAAAAHTPDKRQVAVQEGTIILRSRRLIAAFHR